MGRAMPSGLLLIRKNTKLKAIHNRGATSVWQNALLLIRKNTKLKAIHNCMIMILSNSNVVAYTQKYKIESNSQPSGF